ncbi:MAG: type-F conjugative transfer system secretin TraK [Chlamydiales bacterium]
MTNIFNRVMRGLIAFYYLPLSSAIFHEIDTTTPLHCTFSVKFQNRIMIEEGKVQKVISADEEKLSIFLDDISGQAFIYARDPEPEETTLSIITNLGLVQDIQIAFTDRSSEVVILYNADLENESAEVPSKIDQKPIENKVMTLVSELLLGNIPAGYTPCSIQSQKWKPKRGVDLELMTKLEGSDETLYLYQITNTSSKKRELMECELECEGCRWVFLEANRLPPKQKILGIISVEKNDR